MRTSAVRLFHVTRSRLCEDDIREFSFPDYGYDRYVKVWDGLRVSGLVPESWSYELWEMIGLGIADVQNWGNGDADRFRMYRLFLSSVAFVLGIKGRTVPCHLCGNAITLIDDARDSNDAEIIGLVGDVLNESAREFSERTPPVMENPFLYAAEMVWAQRVGEWDRADAAASVLIAEERRVRKRELRECAVRSQFLFGLTESYGVIPKWNRAFKELKNPNNSRETREVIKALSKERKLGAKLRRLWGIVRGRYRMWRLESE